MAQYDGADLMLTADGDLALDISGDLRIVSGDGFIAQSVYNRLKAVTVDWFYDHIGADLEDFLGRPNTRDTAAAMGERVLAALTAGGLLAPQDIFVKAVPISRTVINLFVFVKTPDTTKPMGFQVAVDLDGGVSVKHVRQEGGV